MSLDAAFEIAMELEQSGDLEAALVSYQTLMAKDARAANNVGVIHYNRQQWGLAADAYRQAVKLDPKFAMAWCNLGSTLTELFSTVEAVNAYETALRLSPRYADAHYNLALLLETKREPRRAIKHWRTYIKLDPTGKSADRARRAIKMTLKTDKLKLTPAGGWPKVRTA